jgi:DNA-binding PadR family transcriptional regulator
VDTLYEETELGKRALRRRLAELRDKGLAVRTGAGKKGDPYLWAAVQNLDVTDAVAADFDDLEEDRL